MAPLLIMQALLQPPTEIPLLNSSSRPDTSQKATGPKSRYPVPLLQEADLQSSKFERLLHQLHPLRLRALFVKSHLTYRTAPDKNPAWLRKRRANIEQSRLYQIPEELVLEILIYTDGVTKQVLRRTCNRFLRIIGGSDLQVACGAKAPASATLCDRLHDRLELRINGRVWDRLVWPVRGLRRAARYGQLSMLLGKDARDAECDNCQAQRSSGRAEQILKQLAKPAWCSGCQKSHPLLLFSATQRRLPLDANRLCIGMQGSVRLCTHKAVTWTELDCLLSTVSRPSTNINIMMRCSERSHKSPRISRKDRRYPEIQDSLGLSRAARPVWYIPMFDLDPMVPVTRQQLQHFLESRPHLFGHTLCPHVTLGGGQLLIPFEPNQYACFDDVDDATSDPCQRSLAPIWHPSHEGVSGEKCCRCLATGNPDRVGNFLPAQYEGANAGLLWDGSHTYSCTECSATYAWVRAKRSRRVYLCVHSYIEPTSPTSWSWIRSVDPESW